MEYEGKMPVTEAALLHPSIDAIAQRKPVEDAASRLFKRKIKKILLIQPPDLDASKFSTGLATRKRYWNYPPYGLLLLARVAETFGCESRCINMQHTLLEHVTDMDPAKLADFDYQAFVEGSIKDAIADFAPDLVGVTCMFSLTHPSFINVIDLVKKHSDAPVSIGGVHVTNAYTDTKTRKSFLSSATAADLIFLKEADTSFAALLKFVNEGGPFPGQVAVKSGDEYLDLPFPARPSEGETNFIPSYQLSPPTNLSRVGRIGTFEAILPADTGIATVLFNRGCRAECTFCSVRNFNGKGVRGRTVASVIDELKILKYDYGINHIMWLDDDLLNDWRKSVELFNAMTRENLKMTWDTTNGVIAASCSDEVIGAAAASGCVGIILGMESGNDEILKKIKKPGNVRHFLKAAEVLGKYPQINSRVFVMIGFPGETFSQMRESHQVVKEMNVDWANINILQPLPNTPIFDEMVQAGMIDPDGMKFEDVSFSLGASGKLSGRRLGGKDMLAESFDDVFRSHAASSIPVRAELDDIWAYMNFHLNFQKLDSITNPEKLGIQYKWLSSICDTLAPTNAFAKYYKCKLEVKMKGQANPKSLNDLKSNLAEQPYWLTRFSEFSLSVDDFGATGLHS